MHSRLSAIFFDLDGTLHHGRELVKSVVARVARAASCGDPRLDPARLAEVYWRVAWEHWGHDYLVNHSSGEELRLLTWREALSELGVHDGELPARIAREYAREIHRTYHLQAEAPRVIAALRRQRHVGLITNGFSDIQWAKIEQLGLRDLLDPLIVSQDVGFAKPDPRIFAVALERVGCSAEEAAHVGDSLADDVAGARGAGLFAVWLRPQGRTLTPGATEPDRVATSLEGVLNIVRERERGGL